MSNPLEFIGPKTAFDAAAEEAAEIWNDPGAAAARDEYWQTGSTPNSGFCETMAAYFQTKYNLSPFDAGRASALGLGGPPSAVIERVKDIVAETEEHTDE